MSKLLYLFAFALLLKTSFSTDHCSKYHYTLTECDSQGNRWRVSVPDDPVCIVTPIEPAKPGPKCGMKCKAGEFLNQTLGTCVPCAAGEFSLGNAIRYEFSAEAKKRYQQQLQNSDGSNSGESSQASDVWKSITLSEFSRNGFPDNDMPRDKSDFSAYIKKKAKCSTVLWDFAETGHLEVRTVPGCVASITLSVVAQRAGHVRFEYQYSRSSSLFGFQMSNGQCRPDEDDSSYWVTEPDHEYDWEEASVKMTPGLNILEWQAFDTRSEKEERDTTPASSRSSSRVFNRMPVRLRLIEIDGVGYSASCEPCPAGARSTSPPSDRCVPCGENSKSAVRSTECTTCAEDEFSPPGSSMCFKKQTCSAQDYYGTVENCESGKAEGDIKFHWLEPMNCKVDGSKPSSKLPEPAKRKCAEWGACNAGQELVAAKSSSSKKKPAAATECRWCREGFWSDGRQPCQPCPPSTSPDYTLDYRLWNGPKLPPLLTTACVSTTDVPCPGGRNGWVPDANLNLVRTAQLHTLLVAAGAAIERQPLLKVNNFYQVLRLALPAFRASTKAEKSEPSRTRRSSHMQAASTTVGVLEFEYEVICASKCQLLVFETLGSSLKPGDEVLFTKENAQGREKQSIAIKSSSAAHYSFAFVYELEASANNAEVVNEARIYSVSVTNLRKIGARSCRPCNASKSLDGCVPCRLGQYMNVSSSKCVQCPEGHAATAAWVESDSEQTFNDLLVSWVPEYAAQQRARTTAATAASPSWPFSLLASVGLDACSRCPPGLQPDANQSSCVSPCGTLRDGYGRTYDLSPFAGIHNITSKHQFSTSGSKFYYFFNFSLCGNTAVTCKNEAPSFKLPSTGEAEDEDHESFNVCRLTMTESRQSTMLITNSSQPIEQPLNKTFKLSSPIGLGDRLIAVLLPGAVHSPVAPIAHQFRAHYRNKLISAGWRSQEEDLDIDFVYATYSWSPTCPNGRTTIITLRCSADLNPDELNPQGSKELPPECGPPGSCDGCTYQLLWRTSLACPRCTEQDLLPVPGECNWGKREIRYIAPKLEYRYSMLVSQSGGQYGGELAAPPSCALDGEDGADGDQEEHTLSAHELIAAVAHASFAVTSAVSTEGAYYSSTNWIVLLPSPCAAPSSSGASARKSKKKAAGDVQEGEDLRVRFAAMPMEPSTAHHSSTAGRASAVFSKLMGHKSDNEDTETVKLTTERSVI